MKSLPNSITNKIDSYCSSREFSHNELVGKSKIYEQLVKLNNENLGAAVMRKGGIDQKSKVLTLLGMHALAGSDQSIEFSVSAALQVGASEEEILDILDLAMLTGGGRAIASAQFAISVLKYRQAAGDKDDRFQFVRTM